MKNQSKFKAKNANSYNWQKYLTPHLSNYIDNFPDVIIEDKMEKEASLLTDIIVTGVTEYFGVTQASK